MTSIKYPDVQNLPAGVAPRANVGYVYDAAGNRTSMSDGLGGTSYNYDQLSRLMSEARTFTGVGTFTLNYDYTLSGALKQFTDATNNMTINYAYDAAGRLSSVTGAGTLYAGVSNYASSFQYRAWGGLKQFSEGSNHTSHVGYNSRLQVNHFDISGNVANQNYDYYADGRISFAHNTTNNNFDRSYFYDHAARLAQARSGGLARGDSGEYPYDQTFGYDQWNNLTARMTATWDGGGYLTDTSSYNNNRRNAWGYDADGRNTTIDTRSYGFDAAGQLASMTAQQLNFNGSYTSVSMTSSYDGDGRKVKEINNSQTTYYLTSSALGGAIVEEMSNTGQKNVGYVYASGQLLAKQWSNLVTWKHPTAAGTSEYVTFNDGTYGSTQFDPLGANLPMQYTPPPEHIEGQGDIGAGHFAGILDSRWSDYLNISAGCAVDVCDKRLETDSEW
ncbi:MAG TPA: hypothetical protein VN920_00335 [Pyrinomonadaceae bacterium]|nr:hypothetical protein [Pyrinomonadaceae bacterium]